MAAVRACDLPGGALLGRYADGVGYTDCWGVDVARAVSHAEYVEAFYTTALFKSERLVLALFASRPSTDLQAAELARGTREAFAAWTVEARTADQLLMCDFMGRTRSWLMTAPSGNGETRLYFGSAVVRRAGATKLDFPFRALLGFHKVYSWALLRAAARRIASGGTTVATL